MGVDIRASILRHIFYGYGSSVVKMKESDKGLLAVAVFIGIFFWSKNVKRPKFGPERVGPRRKSAGA